MKSVLSFIIAVLVPVASLIAQYIQPSPDALGLSKFANVPVNFFTGAPSIGVPLGVVSGQELAIDVSLSYNASGHKVHEVASSVGLGWSLNAGGIITRMVRGLPDDFTNGFCGTANIGEEAAMSNPGTTYNENVLNGTSAKESPFWRTLGGEFVGDIYQAGNKDFLMSLNSASNRLGDVETRNGGMIELWENPVDWDIPPHKVGFISYASEALDLWTLATNFINKP